MATDYRRFARWSARSTYRWCIQSLVVFERSTQTWSVCDRRRLRHRREGVGAGLYANVGGGDVAWSRRRFATPRPLEFSVNVRSPPTRDCNRPAGPFAPLRSRSRAAESAVVGALTRIGEGGLRALRERLRCGGRGARGCELSVWPRSFPFGALRFGLEHRESPPFNALRLFDSTRSKALRFSIALTVMSFYK